MIGTTYKWRHPLAERPTHLSHSQVTTWLRCQHQWYLEKVEQVDRKPAVYLCAGSAVHSVIEQLNKGFYLEQVQGDARI